LSTASKQTHPSTKARYEQKRENDSDTQKVHLHSNVAHPRRPSATCGSDGWLLRFHSELETSTDRRRTTSPCHRHQRISMEDDPRRSALRHRVCRREAATARCGDYCAGPAPSRSGHHTCLASRSTTTTCALESVLPRNTLLGVGGGGWGPAGMQRRLGRWGCRGGSAGGDAEEARPAGATRLEKAAR
jgi:hypothetical protein